MSLFGWVFFGFIVGLLSRALMPPRDPLGLIGSTVLGILGALAGGWTGQLIGWYRPDEGAGFAAATLGSILFLTVYYLIARQKGKNYPSTHNAKDEDQKNHENRAA